MKKMFALLLTLPLLSLLLLSGCNDTPEEPPVIDQENPSSDFEYAENEDGSVTITKYIGTDADVVIPSTIDDKNVTIIGPYAFWEAREFLNSVTMPDTITQIGQCAFDACKKLTTVALSQNLTHIEIAAFINCSSLENITLPNSLTYLGDRAFYCCTALKHINIPNTLKNWGDETFYNSGLETVDFEEGLLTIGDTAFAGTNIRNIVLPQSITIIERQAFGGCPNLESIILNEGLITIESLAFAGTSKLTEIVIPKTVENITERAFSACSTLEKVMFEGDAPQIYIEEDPISGRFEAFNVYYTIYYHEGAKGFTSPEWNGYPTEIY